MSASPEGISFRDGTVEDCPRVMELIKELSEYEKMLSQVKLTVEQLQEDGFGKNPYFQLLIAERRDLLNQEAGDTTESPVVGYALYFKKYSTFEGRSIYLEDIYVTPAFRKKGIGLGLLKKVAAVAIAEKCVRLDFCVLSWNPAIEFYEKLGAVNLTKLEEWHYFRYMGEPLNKLASL